MTHSDDTGRGHDPPAAEGHPGSLLPHPYQSMDPDGRIITVNEAWLDLLGYDRSAVEGRHASAFLANTTRDQFAEHFDDFLDAGTVADVEYEFRRADGKTIDVSFDGRVEYDESGAPVRTHCQFTDITERMANGAELESEKAFIESSLDALSDVFYVYDERGTLLEYNDRFPAVTGYDPDELASLGPASFFPPDRRPAIFDRYERIVEDGEQIRFEEPLLTKEGETIPYEFTASPYHDASGDIAGFVGTGRDVSDLWEQQRHLETLVRNVPGVVYRCRNEPTWPMELVRGRAADLVGYSADRLESGSIRWGTDVVHPADRENVWEAVQAAVDRDEPFEITYRVVTADDETKWVWEQGQAVDPFDVAGRRIEGFITDITERKRLREDLRESKERYESLFNSIRDAVLVADADRRIVDCNPAFTALFGYELEDIQGKPTAAVYADQSEFEEMGERIAAHADDPQFTHRARYQTQSGRVFPGETNVFYLGDQGGSVEGYIGLVRDVSDRLERERRLTAYGQAVEGSTDLLAAADEDHHILFANRAYREYHGLVDEDVQGKSLQTVLGPERFVTIEPHLDRALEGETVEYQMERPGPEGSPRVLDIRYYPLRDDAGDLRGVAAAMRDVTDQEEMKAELAERNRQLTVMDRVLRHNLNNEMNVIRGYADLVRDAADGAVAGYAETIEETSDRLLRIADKQREITKLLAAQPEREEVDLAAVIRRTVDAFRDRHPSAVVAASVPERLTAVATPNVGTAIEELLGNAAVYSDRDEPNVAVTVLKDGDDVVVRVADRGPGIPEMERKVLTGEETIAPLYHGSGLGLWLVNVVVDQSGGTLSFAENDPRGSVVTIRFPRG